MLIQKPGDIRNSEITPKSVYLDRRKFLAAIPAAFLSARHALAGPLKVASKSPFSTTEPHNSVKDVSTYNNFYEFGTQKNEPAVYAKNFKTSPWQVSVEGQ